MLNGYQKLRDQLDSGSISAIEDIHQLVNSYQKMMVVDSDDLIVSVVFVDLTRYPIALVAKFRSDNFSGFNIEYYNKLQNNFQHISQSSIIHTLMTQKTLIGIENTKELEEDDIGDPFERRFLMENDWKSILFHSLFVDEVIFGYLTVFTQENYLSTDEMDKITEFLSQTLPVLNNKLFILAYLWKSEIYQKDVAELEENLSDLVMAITGEGRVVRVNSRSHYYFGKSPIEILGSNLKNINPELHQAITESISDCNPNQKEVRIRDSLGQLVSLELTTWMTKMGSDETIICFAKDITLLKMVENQISGDQ